MFILASDALTGNSGFVTGTIDGKVRQLAEIVSITATVTKSKNAFKCMGYKGTQHKSTGWSGAGSITMYVISSDWNKMVNDYVKTGKDCYFDIMITNEDAGSTAGTQRVSLYRCNIDALDIAKFDANADYLQVTSNFTFEDTDLLEKFKYQFAN
jgi:hypothetical protein